MPDHCNTCKAWDTLKNKSTMVVTGESSIHMKLGLCKMLPPMAIASNQASSSSGGAKWPQTREDDWCMQHSPNSAKLISTGAAKPPPPGGGWVKHPTTSTVFMKKEEGIDSLVKDTLYGKGNVALTGAVNVMKNYAEAFMDLPKALGEGTVSSNEVTILMQCGFIVAIHKVNCWQFTPEGFSLWESVQKAELDKYNTLDLVNKPHIDAAGNALPNSGYIILSGFKDDPEFLQKLTDGGLAPKQTNPMLAFGYIKQDPTAQKPNCWVFTSMGATTWNNLTKKKTSDEILAMIPMPEPEMTEDIAEMVDMWDTPSLEKKPGDPHPMLYYTAKIGGSVDIPLKGDLLKIISAVVETPTQLTWGQYVDIAKQLDQGVPVAEIIANEDGDDLPVGLQATLAAKMQKKED